MLYLIQDCVLLFDPAQRKWKDCQKVVLALIAEVSLTWSRLKQLITRAVSFSLPETLFCRIPFLC